jgi:hypothetical protein
MSLPDVRYVSIVACSHDRKSAQCFALLALGEPHDGFNIVWFRVKLGHLIATVPFLRISRRPVVEASAITVSPGFGHERKAGEAVFKRCFVKDKRH